MKDDISKALSRRRFLVSGTLFTAGWLFMSQTGLAGIVRKTVGRPAVAFPHFPDKLHAFLWRNWNLVPLERIAKVAGANTDEIFALGKAIGLPSPQPIPADQQQRSYLSIIRRNWHLLPREQLLELLEWTDEKLTFTLQEDDFFYIKLGSIKPDCEKIRYRAIDAKTKEREQWVARVLKEEFPAGFPAQEKPLFSFVKELSAPPAKTAPLTSGFSPRFGYAYFALFGDPLLEPEIDPYPNGYLDRMAASGMDGTWMHIVLSKLTPFPWDPTVSEHWEQRLENLKKLVARAKQHGIGIYLYLNEPRVLPLRFFEKYPDLKGVTVGDHAALCTSHPQVQQYLVDSLATITARIPDLAGFFSITASENPTNCWSHGKGADCPRCSKRGPAAVIAELNSLYLKGIRKGISNAPDKTTAVPQLIAWDWGWANGWAEEIIPALPTETALMSVSEWDLDINRGGVKNRVGEYSISAVGPGPRASRHWGIARKHGLKTIAKIQAGTTWELGAVPYIPALENVAQHAVNLRTAKVDGLMLGWTLGGHPSPNLEVVAAIGSNQELSALQAMELVANRRFGKAGPAVVAAWRTFSKAFSEFPYNVNVVYSAPLQTGPSNLLWEKPTGYHATMVGIPYDDVKSWISNYPADVFTGQLDKVVQGFNTALAALRKQTRSLKLTGDERKALTDECNIAETVAIHYSSIVNQVKFINTRDGLAAMDKPTKLQAVATLGQLLRREITLAKRMNVLQGQDPRLGFEATNHYFYTPIDLVEKVINCRDLLDRWLPEIKKDYAL
ncbi:hypothetical protein [Chitinophaga sp. MM2321]|uniref:hypothetical protein n=1 Tax=Chitinophaga sp. MM2321 TaxID=3137178 RepID=UPI0032D57858